MLVAWGRGPAQAAGAAESVAELMGHARLETTRAYTRPTAEDRAKALDLYQSTADHRSDASN